MNRAMHRWIAMACMGLAVRAGAQQRPEFSGVWTVVPSPNAAAAATPLVTGDAPFPTGDMGSGWGSPLTITQDARRLTVTYPFFVPYDLQPPLTFTFDLDGSESRNTVTMGRGVQVQRTTVAWAGDTLVLATRHVLPYANDDAQRTVEVRQSLSLASTGTLVVETTRLGVQGGPATTTRTLYTRR
ncbi:MAG: hypothetical protein ACYC3F_15875 [Gemmatimonadaceae bacterium]